MTKKLFVVILILSVVAMYVASIINAIATNTLIAGESGFPFKDSRATMFGTGTTNYFLMTLNTFFWFVVIWIIWKIFFNKSRK